MTLLDSESLFAGQRVELRSRMEKVSCTQTIATSITPMVQLFHLLRQHPNQRVEVFARAEVVIELHQCNSRFCAGKAPFAERLLCVLGPAVTYSMVGIFALHISSCATQNVGMYQAGAATDKLDQATITPRLRLYPKS